MTMNKRFPMTWEQAVEWLRKQPGREALVKACFFDDPLFEAAKRFQKSEEWAETLKRLPAPPGKALDLGAGRGISSYALAVTGFEVTALEPDPSSLVGAGAVKSLAETSGLPIVVVQEWGERLPFADHSFDVVHARQVLHHACNLPDLCKEAARVLKPGGIFIATREHVVDRPEDLPIFLASHDLHHLFGGENAFSLPQYISAMDAAGFRFREILAPFDSAINFFPLAAEDLPEQLRAMWRWPYTPSLGELVENARRVVPNPGRLFTFVASVPEPAMPEEAADKLRHALVMQQALNDVLQSGLDDMNRRLDEIKAQLGGQVDQPNTLGHSFRWFFRKLYSKLRSTSTQG